MGTFASFLAPEVIDHLRLVIEGRRALDPKYADDIAEGLLTWAMQRGATHYTHWFQPLTGAAAEKHDAFLTLSSKGAAIEKFKGSELLRGEPDASSFPSGGLRTTHSARGYTVWDPMSPPFLWEGAQGLTLCLPSLFFSWTKEALDYKIPLLRSDQKIEAVGLRLAKFFGVPAKAIFSTLGAEQEYFLIERSLYSMRPDLMLAGRTVFGAKPAKGQELEDHYFGAISERVLAFMRDFEEHAIRLGIPLKTRHNEVAPAQHETAPIFEKASLAIDHNLMLMEIMRQTAVRHDLACLLHEKPFQGINGSGKHCNWSLATDTGLNLLDPKGNKLLFLTLLTAVVAAVHEHAAMLRSSIASAGNDHRLGGSEAPPTIISIYLGAALEGIVDDLIRGKFATEPKANDPIDLCLSHMPPHEADLSDRNRTSFFAFTGNKFEFRAVGSAQHPALPITVINAIVADRLALILDELARDTPDGTPPKPDVVYRILQQHLKPSVGVVFGGNGYTMEWEEEAKRRKLPNIRHSVEAFHAFQTPSSIRAFEHILNEKEIASRVEIAEERYAKTLQIEINLMIDLCRTRILPAALDDQKTRAGALERLSYGKIKPDERIVRDVETLQGVIGDAIEAIDALALVREQVAGMGFEAKAKILGDLGRTKMQRAREIVDRLEAIVDAGKWPLPKYEEMLFWS
ncbi:MAG: glutamine synthetase [Chlamydiota bacterium]|jgi:glutamine synthetase